MGGKKDALNKIRIANVKIQLIALSSRIKTHKEKYDLF